MIEAAIITETAADYLRPIFESAWAECGYAKVQDQQSFVSRQLDILDDCDRVDIILKDGDAVVGGCVLVDSNDLHTTECITALHTFILPEYRSFGNVRLLKRMIRAVVCSSDYRWVCTSKCIGPLQFCTTYTEVSTWVEASSVVAPSAPSRNS